MKITHVRYLPGSARLEFRPGKHGGWALRYVDAGPHATLYHFVYYGPDLPRDAIKVSP